MSKPNKRKNAKTVYKKMMKKPAQTIISNQDQIEKSEKAKNIKVPWHPIVVPPTQKYLETMKYIKEKKFFIDAASGFKVYWNTIKEFHVTDKDTPVLLCEIVYKDKEGNTQPKKKVYHIVRYNPIEIVGLNSKNINIWMLKTVKIDLK